MITLDDDLRAYSDTADLLRETFAQAGYYAMRQLHIGLVCATAIIFVSGDSDAVAALMARQHLTPQMVDFHDTERGVIVTWSVRFAGHEIAVVAAPPLPAQAPALAEAA